jgi:hypothetical protein
MLLAPYGPAADQSDPRSSVANPRHISGIMDELLVRYRLSATSPTAAIVAASVAPLEEASAAQLSMSASWK